MIKKIVQSLSILLVFSLGSQLGLISVLKADSALLKPLFLDIHGFEKTCDDSKASLYKDRLAWWLFYNGISAVYWPCGKATGEYKESMISFGVGKKIIERNGVRYLLMVDAQNYDNLIFHNLALPDESTLKTEKRLQTIKKMDTVWGRLYRSLQGYEDAFSGGLLSEKDIQKERSKVLGSLKKPFFLTLVLCRFVDCCCACVGHRMSDFL